MLEIFRRNHFANSLLLLPYAVMLRILVLLLGPEISYESQGLWSEWLLGKQYDIGMFEQVLAILLVFLHAAMVNRLVIRNRMTHIMSLFPGVFYILIVSFFAGYSFLSPVLLANTFVLIGLMELFSSHKKSGTSEHIFSIGFWFSCAALTYSQYDFLIIFAALGLSILRTVKLVNWVQFLVGMVTPVLISGMLAYLMGKPVTQIFASFGESIGFVNFGGESGWVQIIQIAFFSIWLLATLLQYNPFTLKKNIHAQKKVDLCYWLLLFGGIIAVFSSKVGEVEWLVLAVPLSILMAMTFLRIRNKLSAELIHFLLLISILVIQIVIFV